MIADFVRLSALYLVGYLYVRHSVGKEMAMLVKWLGAVSLGLMILSGVAAPFKQLSNDIHSVAVTYSQGKEKVNSLLGESKEVQKQIGNVVSPAGAVGYQGIWERFTGNAKFSWPVKGEVTQGYNEHNHGLDIAGKVGDPIRVSRPGTVQKVATDSIYGLYLIIDHGNNYGTLYAHCSKILVVEGKMILGGEKIAEIGSTGNSTGPHLHFEIRVGGKTVDPKDFMK